MRTHEEKLYQIIYFFILVLFVISIYEKILSAGEKNNRKTTDFCVWHHFKQVEHPESVSQQHIEIRVGKHLY